MWLTDLLTDKRTDRWTDKRVAGGHYCWGVLLWPPQLGLGGKCDKKWKFKNVEKITSFLTLWPWPLTYDLEKLIRSGHYHYQCVYQIWEQSIPWFLSYRVNTIAGGGRLRRKTITSPNPLDTGDIIILIWRESAWWMLSYSVQKAHCMMTSFSTLLALFIWNSPVTGRLQRPVMRSFDVFFDLRLIKRLSKQLWGWWFEMQLHSLWHHCNGQSLLGEWQWCCTSVGQKNIPVNSIQSQLVWWLLSYGVHKV